MLRYPFARSLALSLALLLALPAAAQDAVTLSVALPPPPLPQYDQPPLPEPGSIWTPGYWHWSPDGYYWVPGTWVLPPDGMLWTPPYWGWADGGFLFHAGYWGPHVGYYGGVDYGYGYGGRGYQGGRWQDGGFVYNSRVNNFGAQHAVHSYAEDVGPARHNPVSYAGGKGGLRVAPNAPQRAAEREPHQPVTPEQARHVETAAHNPDLAVSHNQGRPAIAATQHPAQFEGAGVIAARPAAAPRAASAAREVPKAAPAAREAPRAEPAHEAPRAEPAREAPRAAPAVHEAPRPAPAAHEAPKAEERRPEH